MLLSCVDASPIFAFGNSRRNPPLIGGTRPSHNERVTRPEASAAIPAVPAEPLLELARAARVDGGDGRVDQPFLGPRFQVDQQPAQAAVVGCSGTTPDGAPYVRCRRSDKEMRQKEGMANPAGESSGTRQGKNGDRKRQGTPP